MPAFFNPIQAMEKMDFAKTVPATNTSVAVPFRSVLQDAMDSTQALKAVADQDGYNLALGDVNNLAQLQINSQKAEAMLQTTVQLTTRVVNAYKEVMQMQV